MEFMIIFKAIISRLIFISHGTLVVYMYNLKMADPRYWALITPLVFLLIESIVLIIYKKGLEYKYVWPSGFCYITCVVPIIWLIEMDLYEAAVERQTKENGKVDYESLKETEQEKIKRQIVLYIIDMAKGSERLKKICELGLVLCIIIARWFMPRGELTKDQLSALLLAYVGNSADILELFDTFEEPELAGNKPVFIAIMSVFTWSIYQFTLVTTATVNKGGKGEEQIRFQPPKTRSIRVEPATAILSGEEMRTNADLKKDYMTKVRKTSRKISSSNNPYDARGRGKKKSVVSMVPDKAPINEEATEEKERVIKQRAVHGELYQILVTLCMQDGPFLILRLYLLIELNVSSEMHIFFTCKNAIVTLLLVYRLLILSCNGTDEEPDLHREAAAVKLRNIQMAIQMNETLKYNLTDISVK